VVAIDCPGYGESEGFRQTIRSYPTAFLTATIKALGYPSGCAFALMGHSQGGAVIFNAVSEQPSICHLLVQERVVCSQPERFKALKQPTLLIFDTEDDGHPIRVGKLLHKYIPNNRFEVFTMSKQPVFILILSLISYSDNHSYACIRVYDIEI
jgi:pimeloyl-ACP methyl ester carboxylesterase